MGRTAEQQATIDYVNNNLEMFGKGGNVAHRLGDQVALQTDIQNGPEKYPGIGNESWEDATARYRQRGADLQHRTGPVLDQTQADQARGLQMSGLDMLRRQADGSAPSSAGILADRANQNAVMAAGHQVTGARTAAGGIAALRGAGEAAGASALAGNAQNANARAGEIIRGQGA